MAFTWLPFLVVNEISVYWLSFFVVLYCDGLWCWGHVGVGPQLRHIRVVAKCMKLWQEIQ